MRKIALIGHSHSVSILDAIADWRPQAQMNRDGEDSRYTRAFQGWFSVDTGGRLFELEPYPEFTELSGMQVCLITDRTFSGNLASLGSIDQGEASINVSDFLASFIQRISDFDVIVSVLHGNEHAVLGLIDNLPAYDFSPFDVPVQGQPIDTMYIDAIVNQLTSRVVAPLAAIRSAVKHATILHIPPPPPLRDPSQASVLEILKEDIEKYGLVRPSLRQKWHTTYVNTLKAQLEPWQVMLVEPNYEPACENGFLKLSHAEGLTHGNADYGKLVAGRIAQLSGSEV